MAHYATPSSTPAVYAHDLEGAAAPADPGPSLPLVGWLDNGSSIGEAASVSSTVRVDRTITWRAYIRRGEVAGRPIGDVCHVGPSTECRYKDVRPTAKGRQVAW